MASATCGRNMVPYWVLDSPYSLFSVKMVLAAGKVTRTMPCTSPAALMIVRSVLEAIWHPGRSGPQVRSARSCRPLPQSVTGARRCHPPSRDEEHADPGASAIMCGRQDLNRATPSWPDPDAGRPRDHPLMADVSCARPEDDGLMSRRA